MTEARKAVKSVINTPVSEQSFENLYRHLVGGERLAEVVVIYHEDVLVHKTLFIRGYLWHSNQGCLLS